MKIKGIYMLKPKSLLILGAGTHGKVVAGIANACGYEPKYLDG